MLRFAILKQVGEGSNLVVLEYNAEQILSRLQSRVKENLAGEESKLRIRHTKLQVAEALTNAFNELVSEFKEETVKLK